MAIKAGAYALCLGVAVMLSGCEWSTEARIATAAQQRWDSLISGDAQTAYHYYSDAFQQTTPYEHFKNKVHGTGLWSRAKVNEVKCEASGERCQVAVDVTVTMKMRGLSTPVDTTDRVSETWVKQGWFSDWRYVKQ